VRGVGLGRKKQTGPVWAEEKERKRRRRKMRDSKKKKKKDAYSTVYHRRRRKMRTLYTIPASTAASAQPKTMNAGA
jgi:hypothetical protein